MPTTGVARLSLESGTDPGVDTGHAILVRARVWSGLATLSAALYEGANNRSGDLTTGTLATTLTDYTLPIPSSNVANITDYSNLEVRFWGESAASASTFEVDSIGLQLLPGEEIPAEHSAVTLAAYAPTAKTSTLAGHASITITAHTALATAFGAPTGVYPGHASIDFWASDGEYSDLDVSSDDAEFWIFANRPMANVGASPLGASTVVAAYDAVVTLGNRAFAEHASIVLTSDQPAHGVSAGHAAFSAVAGDGGGGFEAIAGLASSQFSVNAYDAVITTDSIVLVFAELAEMSVGAPVPTTSVGSSVGHAEVTIGGYDVTTPRIAASLEVEIYNSVTIDVLVSRYVEVSLDVEVY